MTDPRIKVRGLLLVVLMVVGTIPAASVAPVAADTTGNDGSGNAPTDPGAFHLQQGDRCYEVGTLGDGTESVEEFYDYRNPETEPSSGKYASFGTTHLQDNQDSKLFVYDGSDGYSLVVLHDEMNQTDGGSPYGSTVTFDLTGVGDSTWVVKDDEYDDGNQDDNWDTSGNTHHIDWMWSGDRNDGGALADIADKEITIDPGFNENADEWDSWDFAGEEENRIGDWDAIDEVGEYYLNQSLDKSESVTVEAGTCTDSSAPNAALTSQDSAANDGTVTLDASDSTDDDEDIQQYHWDVDGDGGIDEQTDAATLEHTYASAGNYEPTVIVVDSNHKESMASTTVEVKDGSGGGDDGDGGGDGGDGSKGAPTAKLSLDAETVNFADKVSFNASASTDDSDIVRYKWDLDGDGTVERTTPDDATNGSKTNFAHTVTHVVYSVYDENRTYTPEVTVVDDDGNTDTATAKLTVERDDYTAPNATIDVPPEVEVGEEFTVTASDFTEDKLAHVCWVFAENHDMPEGAVANYTFEETGKKKVTLHLRDPAGNENMLTRWIEVTEADDGDDGNDGNDGNDGDDDNPDRGYEDPDNRDSRSGGIPGADPGNDDKQSNNEAPLEEAPRNVTENLTDDDGRFGTVVATADDGSEVTIEVYNTAPAGLPAPTPAQDGFEAVSFLTADGADRATVTIASDRLDAMDATPEQVSLFRYENGTWTAVETTVANATGDTYQFRANVTSGTYAVGVEQPAISATGVNVRDATVAAGDSATVAVTVENAGLANGTDEVSLLVDGDVVATETVSLSAEEWTTLRFTPTFDAAGTYEVTVGNASAEVVVEAVETRTTTTTETTTEMNDPDTTTDQTTTDDESTGGTPGFGVGVALVALLASALLALRRR